jgi:glycosyltransferase involved in cell wall biosynthesis
MAAGTPVVAAARGALPETVGEAGLLVNPDRPGELAGALSELVSDASLRAKLVDAGRRRAARFSWDTTAARTDAVIAESLAASSYRRSDRP